VIRHSSYASKRRSGFTLIELLVVISIIAILAGLTLAGVMYFLRKGPEVTARNDIMQISTGLQNFKVAYGRYPPSQIRLRANMQDYTTKRVDALDDASLAFLTTMFKSLPAVTNIAWAGATPMPAGGIILEGDQCLVFFLGGPPIGGPQPGLQGGFSTNPVNPVDPATNRKNYMGFETGRLVNRSGSPFPSYADPFGSQQPYVYFSSSGFVATPTGGRFGKNYDTTFFTGPASVAPANSFGMKPYFTSPGKGYLPDLFQIISAGRDGQFGPGGAWTPGTSTGGGADDLSNFYDKFHGN